MGYSCYPQPETSEAVDPVCKNKRREVAIYLAATGHNFAPLNIQDEADQEMPTS